ncbi:hypothetical protein SAMN05216388_1002336 [Halorientalis persicus]|uniref:RCK C-terminal domain-containing protein n=1 Tax=Halorientalis persicus TaxID=1367881 RepID=A0A1H8FNI7_9EURY|nr:TrkA C-terminal domain-containing protein [Halorientalis persicus]SEN33263.1 hypothetical protein SAMN05216388_1002336 [Halorientalis persicus]
MIDPILLQSLAGDWTKRSLLHILGFGLYAGVVATGVAFVYRKYTTYPLPIGASIVVGTVFPAIWLNLVGLLRDVIVQPTPLLHYGTGAYLLGAFFVSAVASAGGRWIGDHLACEVFGITRLDAHGELARLVRSAGLVIAVELPDTVADAEGYPSVDEAVKRELAGRRLLFPRRLSVEELESRLVTRIERDFPVDHVSVSVTDEGEVTYLAVGTRPAGIGPSLPPETVAVAVRGDPPADASTGDPVEVWTDDDADAQLVATGTFRASVGDVTTLQVAADDADDLAAATRYRLVTQPADPDDVNELVSVVRVADETVTSVTVAQGGALDGEFAGWLPVDVLVVDRGGETVPFPDDRDPLQAGDTVYVLGTPGQLRDLAEYERDRDRQRNGEGEPVAADTAGAETEAAASDD